jgi:hypothetical protein
VGAWCEIVLVLNVILGCIMDLRMSKADELESQYQFAVNQFVCGKATSFWLYIEKNNKRLDEKLLDINWKCGKIDICAKPPNSRFR